MPDISGDDVLDHIRSKSLDCRVAMVTGIQADYDIVKLGFDDYVVKPVSKNELCDLVQTLIDLATYSKEIQEAYQIAAKISVLVAEKPARELPDSNEYGALQHEFQDLSESLDRIIAEFDHDDIPKVFREVTP